MTMFGTRIRVGILSFIMIAITATIWPNMGHTADLYRQGSWSALASDRVARQVGDSLTILIYENSVATNTAQNGSVKNSRVSGQLKVGSALNEGANLSMDGGFQGSSQTSRSGKMVAQVSVAVDAVLPNGDLKISGAQALRLNGEHTNIKIKGLVRPADISSDNTVLSTRISNVTIDYDGSGFVSRSSKPGIVTRIFNWLGVL